jgi:heavy metal translocating P-type ATPase
VLAQLEPPPLSISHSIIEHTITVTHSARLSVRTIKKALENEGYEVDSVIANPLSHSPKVLSEDTIASDPERERPKSLQFLMSHTSPATQQSMQERHRANCKQCQVEQGEAAPQLPELALEKESRPTNFIAVDSGSAPKTYIATLTVDGMTCASCVSNVTRELESKPWVEAVNVNLLTKSATVNISGEEHAQELVLLIKDLGYDAALDKLEELSHSASRTASESTLIDTWRATYSIGGMTCSSCVGNISRALKEFSWIQNVDINLVTSSAVIVFVGKSHLKEIASRIEDIGYEANLNVVTEADPVRQIPNTSRTIQIRIEGMYCGHCPGKVMGAVAQFNNVKVDQFPTLKEPVLRITYFPDAPTLTIRAILSAISNADPAFHPYIFHPMTIEERSRKIHIREQRQILYRLLFSVLVAIPTFTIGIVLMNLVPKNNSAREYLMEPLGGASRAEWALFIMSTPVYFLAADIFHRRTIKEVRALWRKRSPTPISQRFYRFGSMNMLISLGTTVAYVSSIAEMAVDAAQNKSNKMLNHVNPTYFDSVVFLTMFLLIGRYIEAHSKAKTGDAVAALGKLRPTTALLQATNAYATEHGRFLDGFQKVNIDLVDRGDVVRVPHGGSPPCDGTVISGSAEFDESSLTGESRPVTKQVGDDVYSGTVNLGSAISIRVTGVAGNSMLDRIMRIVREGQGRRAPVERVADRITGYFVPLICFLAVVTWLVWLGLGTSGTLPISWRDTANNWPFWSLQFAIAVFVVACPCGIGLAAPTALFVGGGLAAKFGILVKGGGEAFQEASNLDCIVFDKTGTLTQGGEPVVTDFVQINEYPDATLGEENIVSLVRAIEEDSSHPLAKAIVSFSEKRLRPVHGHATKQDTTEIPGKGMKGIARLPGPSLLFEQDVQILVGNEKLMAENIARMPPGTASTLDKWKRQGKSVVLVALKMHVFQAIGGTHGWWVVAIFAVSDPIRPEAPHVVQTLQKKNIDVWMISGDNHTTAFAIGDKLGIFRENVIAGVLPEQKAQKIKRLQISQSKRGSRRATVAMVGDGINDSPALTNADVGIAIGSGSDVAINAASFVLLTSELTALLTLIDLSRTVFRRIKFNFCWALVYNIVALPIAAGVLYPVTTKAGDHIRLDPAWAALAMALSSVSVVCSSLLLRSRLPGVGFRKGKSKNY